MAEQLIGLKVKLEGKDALNTVGAIRKDIKEANSLLIAAQEHFGEYSSEAREAARRVAELKDKLGEAAETAALFDPGKKFQVFAGALNAVAGGFSAVQGALGLIGVESEAVEKQLLKVQSALALSQGLSVIADSAKDFQRLKAVLGEISVVQKVNAASNRLAASTMTAFGVSVNTTAVSFRVLKTAIAATGIGLLVVAIGAAVEAFSTFESAATRAANAQKSFNEQSKKIADEGLKAEQEFIDRQTKLLVSQVKARGGTAEEIAKIERDALENRKKSYQRYFDEVVGLDKQAALDIEKNIKDLNAELIIQDNNAKAAQLERQKQQDEKLAQEREQTRQEREQQTKEANQQLLELQKENTLLVIEDEQQRAIKSIEIDLKNNLERIDQLKINEKIKKELRAQLQKKADEEIRQLNERRLEKETKEEAEYQKKVAEVRAEVQLNAIKDEDVRSIEAIKLKYQKQFDEITAQEKQTNVEQTELRKALLEQQAQEIESKDTEIKAAAAEKQIAYNKSLIDNEQLSFDIRRQFITESLNDLDYFFAQGLIKEDEYNKQKKGLTDARIKLIELEKQGQMSMLQAYAEVAGGISQLVGQNTAVGKALAIAQTTIDTYVSTSAMYAQASKNPITILNPAYPYIVAASSVIAGLARVKAIASVKVPFSGGGGGGAPSVAAPNISTSAPIRPTLPLTQTITQLQSGSINQLQNASVRAYVVESDITSGQERIRRLNRAARLG